MHKKGKRVRQTKNSSPNFIVKKVISGTLHINLKVSQNKHITGKGAR